MKAGKAKIGICQKMRIKNLRGVIRNFLRNGRLRVKSEMENIILKNFHLRKNVTLNWLKGFTIWRVGGFSISWLLI